MNIRTFLLSFIIVYILISLPAMLGSGTVIDWVSEATFLQKFKGYVIDGLVDNYLMKLIVSTIVGLIFSLVLPMKRKANKSE